ncbi:hypothetical protein CMUS01_06542 [Colletotrichum musicola]|uniref:Uncharacterized protein n=1 Tax=Colletotrichum musicola TaxID=2175873 RepID=A0A8H6NHY4_9PEZI|nr:hypothetical protein CMUS01_06542 [Colletotrichum musicola]
MEAVGEMLFPSTKASFAPPSPLAKWTASAGLQPVAAQPPVRDADWRLAMHAQHGPKIGDVSQPDSYLDTTLRSSPTVTGLQKSIDSAPSPLRLMTA